MAPLKCAVNAPRENLVAALQSYGEDDAAGKIADLPDADHQRIAEIAFVHACTGMLLAKALSLAAVEVIEGRPRPLRRNRRKFT
jgi:hypothetical protein